MDTEMLMRLMRAYSTASGLTLATVSTYAAAAGGFYERLRAGHDITTRRAGRVTQWLSDHWPEDLEWPADIPRPATRPDRDEAA